MFRALKVSLDGALGSYGAWLLESYNDRKDFLGQNTFSIPELKADRRFRLAERLTVMRTCHRRQGEPGNH